jgi:release factor glutamine methyltransferase
MPDAELACPVTVRLREATARLASAGVDTPSLDAELLLAHALEVRRDRLLVDPPQITDEAAARFEELLGRRIEREPVAYILGNKHFRWINVLVDPRVLVPRPETELLVEIGLALPSGSRVVDVGTGSGAVALALAFERPDLEVWGTELSADALAVAEENAARLRLDVQFVEGDLLDGVPCPIDAVLANLPYVVDGTPLQLEIARYEPPEALFAGPDGLAVMRRLVSAVATAGVPFVALEVGEGQAAAVAELLHGQGYRTETYRDLAGHERVVVGRGTHA